MALDSWCEIAAVALGALVFSATFGHFALVGMAKPPEGWDWDQNLLYHWVPYETVRRFHQFPLWNPYTCGGSPMLANPPSRIVTPFFLLHLLVGPVVAIHLEVVLHLALAAAGGYVLARVLGFGRLAAVTTAVVYPGSSTHYLHLGVGHTAWLPYAYLPWAVACVWAAIATHRVAPAALAGLFLAIMVGEGGMYAAPHTAIFIALLTVAVAIARRSVWPLVVLSATGIFAFGFAAVRFLPLLGLMSHHPRPVSGAESVSPEVMLQALFSRTVPVLPPGYSGFHEYGAYLGVCAALLAGAGVALRWRSAWPWVLAGVVILSLAFGDLGGASPWALLHRAPLFSSQHVPSRFLAVFVFVAAVLGGFGVDALVSFGRRGVLVAALLLLGGTIDAFLVGPPHLLGISLPEETSVTRSAQFEQIWDPAPLTFPRMFANAQANRGTLNCYDPVHVPTAAVGVGQPGYRGEHHLTGRGTVRLTRWSPNALDYDVDVPDGGSLIVNQNFYPPWTLVRGNGEVHSHDGLLAVRLPAGRQQIALRYRDRLFYGGAIVSVTTAIATLSLCRWFRRSRSRPRI